MDNSIGKTQNFLFYSSDDGKINVQVVVDNVQETIWTTQKGMSEIFGVDVSGISRHINSILNSGELDEKSNLQKMQIANSDKPVVYYSLDMIIAVGYRVNSYKATQFRIWATRILKEYLIKGFALDDDRLKQGSRIFGKDHFKELVERIQEIRASERNFYEKITDIFRDCSDDYDSKSPITQAFYAAMQNKFHYAILQHTAPEIIKSRANASKQDMGLKNWKNQKKGGKIYKSDVVVAKNYLSEQELKGLNKVVNMFLDYAERIAEQRKGSFTMADWANRLDMFLNFNEYPILTNAGSIRSEIAKKFAENEYSKFRVVQDREYKSDFNLLLEASHNGLPIEQPIKKDQYQSSFNNKLSQALNYNPHKDIRNNDEGE